MPITTEEEPEDIDDDAPARVGLCHTSHWEPLTSSLLSLLCVLSTLLLRPFRQLKFSRLSGARSNSISLPSMVHIVEVPCWLWEFRSRAAASL